MNGKISSVTELYNRLLPALRTKKHELNRDGIRIVKEKDIWDYNRLYNWKNATGLTIFSMVDSILNTDGKDYEDFVINKK